MAKWRQEIRGSILNFRLVGQRCAAWAASVASLPFVSRQSWPVSQPRAGTVHLSLLLPDGLLQLRSHGLLLLLQAPGLGLQLACYGFNLPFTHIHLLTYGTNMVKTNSFSSFVFGLLPSSTLSPSFNVAGTWGCNFELLTYTPFKLCCINTGK